MKNPDKFTQAWNAAGTLKEFAAEMGLDPKTATRYASRLRKEGYELKSFAASNGGFLIPTPEEVEERKREIQSNWSERERNLKLRADERYKPYAVRRVYNAITGESV